MSWCPGFRLKVVLFHLEGTFLKKYHLMVVLGWKISVSSNHTGRLNLVSSSQQLAWHLSHCIITCRDTLYPGHPNTLTSQESLLWSLLVQPVGCLSATEQSLGLLLGR